jgi:peptide/nickel transport system substrate-binding protein
MDSNYWTRRRPVTRRRLLGAAVATGTGVASLALVGCGSSGNGKKGASTTATGSTAAAARGGTLKVGGQAALVSPNAPYNYDGPYIPNIYAIWDNLIRYDSADLTPVARLAKSWEFNGDKTEITLELRPGLTYHSGAKLDAQSVVDGFKSLTDPATPVSQVAGVAKAYVDSVAAVDPTHAKFTLKRPGDLIFDMFEYWYVSNPANIAAIKAGQAPDGSGPFKVTAIKPNQGGTLAKFPDYYDPAVLDGIDYKQMPNQASMAVALKSGDADIILDPTYDDSETLGKSGYDVYTTKSLIGEYNFGMNTKGEVTKDARLRKALYHCVDRQRINDAVFLSKAHPMNCLWPSSSPAYEKRYDADPYDLAEAKKLVEAAGFSNGTPDLEVMIGSSDATNLQIFNIIQASAKQAGINLKVNQVDPTTFSSQFTKGAYPACFQVRFGFNALHPDTLFVMNFQVRLPNSENFDTPEYQKFQSDIAAAKTTDERKALYQAFNKIWDDEMWVFLTVSQPDQYVANKKVKNFSLNDFSAPSMAKVGLS